MTGFYESREWRELRYRVLRKSAFKCAACGAKGESTILHVDHVKPRSKHPELELDEANLQVLCEDCNLGKSNLYEDRFVEEELEVATTEEKQEKLSLQRILLNFNHLADQAGLSEQKAASTKRLIEHKLKKQELVERARRLVRHVRSGSFDGKALASIIEMHSKPLSRGIKALIGGDDDGSAA